MDCHRHMGHHFIIYKFICIGKNNFTIQCCHFSKFIGFKYIYLLIFTFSRKKLLLYPDIQFYINCMIFRKPHLHIFTSCCHSCQYLKIFHCRIFGSLHGASFFFCIQNIFRNLFCNPFPWGKDRNPRWVAHDKLSTDASHGIFYA